MGAKRTVDVVVVGLGVMGAAALYELARRGVSVVGIERHASIGNPYGSSTGETRVIRKAYAEEPRYVPLVLRAYELWAELMHASGGPFLRITGGLHMGPPSHPSIASIERAVGLHGLDCERLSADEIRSRFPVFTPEEDDIGLLEPDAGVLSLECINSLLFSAVRYGAEMEAGVDVTSIEDNENGVAVVTAKGDRFNASHVIVTLGGYATLATPIELGLPLEISRQVQCWFSPKEPTLFHPDVFPVFIHHTERGDFYGIPNDLSGPPGREGVKVCRHYGGAPSTVDTIDRQVRDADVDVVRAYLRKHLPAADSANTSASVCFYTNTPDRHFVVGPMAGRPRVLVGVGFSGHGFKFAPTIAEILADLAIDGSTRHDIEMFAPDRF